MAYLKKLSGKIILGGHKPDAPPRDHKGPMWLYRIAGICTGKEDGESDYGHYVSMLGEFQGINLETGEEFRTQTKCYMPDVVCYPVINRLGMDGVSSVSFAYKVGVQRDESAATNYVYVAEPIAALEQSDPLGALLEKIDKPQLENKSKGAKR